MMAIRIFSFSYILKVVKQKVKESRYGLEWPRGFQEVKVPRFHDNGTGWLVRLSALRTGRPLPRVNTAGTHFC